MASFQKLPSGSWRALVRRSGATWTKTPPSKRLAQEWPNATEIQVASISATGVTQTPAGATIGDLIEGYEELRSAIQSGSAFGVC